ALAYLRIAALCRHELGDAAGYRRKDPGTAQIGVGLLLGGLRLLELTRRLLLLGPQHVDLFLPGNKVGLRAVQRGLLLPQVGGGLLRLLLGARAAPQQFLRARVLVLREGERRLRLR